MKSSTLMAIVLVVQTVLIMGVVFAAVSIENSAVVGEEEGTLKPNPGVQPCCKRCSSTEPVKCEDEGNWKWCRDHTNCTTCLKARNSREVYRCNDDFHGTCDPKCKKN